MSGRPGGPARRPAALARNSALGILSARPLTGAATARGSLLQCRSVTLIHAQVRRKSLHQSCVNLSTYSKQICNISSFKSVDCTWGGWEPWGDCTKTCGGGVQLRTRLFFAGNSGKMCSGQSASMQECNQTPCPTQTADKTWFFYDHTD